MKTDDHFIMNSVSNKYGPHPSHGQTVNRSNATGPTDRSEVTFQRLMKYFPIPVRGYPFTTSYLCRLLFTSNPQRRGIQQAPQNN